MAEFLMGILAMGAGVFAASGIGKLRSRPAYRAYRAGLRATRLVPGRLHNAVAAALAAVEAVTAAALAGAAALLASGSPGAYPLAEFALAVAAALAAVLAAGVMVAVSRGTRAPCACFGGSSARPLGTAHLIRNSCLAALLAAGLIASGFQHAQPGLASSALAVAAGLAVALLVTRWDDLAALFAPLPPARGIASAPPGRPGRHGKATR